MPTYLKDFETYPNFTLHITDVKLMTHRSNSEKVNIYETFKKLSSRYGLTTKIGESKSYIPQLEQILDQVEELFINSPQIYQLNFKYLDKLTPKTLPIKETSDYAVLVQMVIIEVQCLVNEISYKEGSYDGHYILRLGKMIESINHILVTLKKYHQELCEEEEIIKAIKQLSKKSPQHGLLLFLPDLSIEEVIDFINKAPQRVLTNEILSRFVNRAFLDRKMVFCFYFIKAVNCTFKQNYLKHLGAYYEEELYF